MKRVTGLCLTFLLAPAILVAQNVDHVFKGNLPPGQRDLLQAIGDRLEKPGKERQTIVATLDRYSKGKVASSAEVTLTFETPGLLRLENPSSHEVIVFNGNQTQKSHGNPAKEDLDVVESVANDTVEPFILDQFNGSYVRLIGTFRIADSRATDALSGTCDLYESSEVVRVRNTAEEQRKTFCFDTKSQLLHVVAYRRSGTAIETRFNNWTQVGNQMIPATIARFENSAPVFVLTVKNVALSAKKADGLFTP